MFLREIFVGASLALFAAAASAGPVTSLGGSIEDNAPSIPLIVNFVVTESGPLASLDLTLTGLSHTWIGDLIATLTAPDMTTVDILRRTTQTSNGATTTVGSSANFAGNYRFIDSGANLSTTIGSNTSTFNLPSGDYLASSRTVGLTSSAPLSLNALFAGTSLFGTWVLKISDNATADTGSLTSATLNVSAVPQGGIVAEPTSLALVALALAGMSAARRRSAA